MSGWYVVLVLACAINGIAIYKAGYCPHDLLFWIWITVPALTYVAGRRIGSGD